MAVTSTSAFLCAHARAHARARSASLAAVAAAAALCICPAAPTRASTPSAAAAPSTSASAARARARARGVVGVREACARAQYRVEAALTRSLVAQNAALWGGFGVLVVAGGVAYRRATGYGAAKAYWRSWCALSGAEPDFSEDPWRAKVVVGVLTVAQLLFFAVLVGAVEAAFGRKVAELGGGRTRVFETGHEVVLGWNSRLPDVLRHVAAAGESNRERLRVVVLADREKAEMDRLVQEAVPRDAFRRVLVICRSGDPASAADQRLVAAHRASKVVVLSDGEGGMAPAVADALAFKAALALKHAPAGDAPGPVQTVVENTNPASDALVSQLGANFTHLRWPDLASRHLVKSALQPPGVAEVHRNMLMFEGSELYRSRFPELEGLSVGDTCARLKSAVLVGIVRAKSGRVLLNPHASERVREGDALIVLAEDKTKLKSSLARKPAEARKAPSSAPLAGGGDSAGGPAVVIRRPRQHVLVLGWRPGMGSILSEINGMVARGSRVSIVAGSSEASRKALLASEGSSIDTFRNIRVQHVIADPCDHSAIAKRASGADSVLVLLDHASPAFDDRQRESRVLESIVAVRTALKDSSVQPKISAEVMTTDTEELVAMENPDIDCMSLDDFSALLLAQAAYEPDMLPILRTLLSQDGPEVALRNASSFYGAAEDEATFDSLIKRGRERRETLLGYVHAADGSIVLNPVKGAKLPKHEVRHFIAVVEDIHAVLESR